MQNRDGCEAWRLSNARTVQNVKAIDAQHIGGETPRHFDGGRRGSKDLLDIHGGRHLTVIQHVTHSVKNMSCSIKVKNSGGST